MIQTESTLTPEEIQLCLVLHCLIEDLAILIEQMEVLEYSEKNYLQIILP